MPRWLLLPPASPLIRSSGCPSFRISGFTGDRSSSRLDSLSFGGAGSENSRLPLRFAYPVSPTISTRVAPDAHPPVPADFGSESPRSSVPSGCPCRISGLLRLFALGFVAQTFPKSPWFRLLNVADSVCLESPRNFLPRLIRICFHRLRLFPPLRLGR